MKSKYRDLLSVLSAFVLGLAAILPCGGCASSDGLEGFCYGAGIANGIFGAIIGGAVGYAFDEPGAGAAVGGAIVGAVAIEPCLSSNRKQTSKQIDNHNPIAAFQGDTSHYPIAAFQGDISKDIVRLSASPGEAVKLSAEGSIDPDGDQLYYRWWQHRELGSFHQAITITDKMSRDASFIAPSVSEPRTIHLLLTVTDYRDRRYYPSSRKIIVTVKPK